jgi:hypothetical protein
MSAQNIGPRSLPMRQVLFAVAALAATVAVIALPFFALRLLGQSRNGGFLVVVAVVVLAAAVLFARRDRI